MLSAPAPQWSHYLIFAPIAVSTTGLLIQYVSQRESQFNSKAASCCPTALKSDWFGDGASCTEAGVTADDTLLGKYLRQHVYDNIMFEEWNSKSSDRSSSVDCRKIWEQMLGPRVAEWWQNACTNPCAQLKGADLWFMVYDLRGAVKAGGTEWIIYETACLVASSLVVQLSREVQVPKATKTNGGPADSCGHLMGQCDDIVSVSTVTSMESVSQALEVCVAFFTEHANKSAGIGRVWKELCIHPAVVSFQRTWHSRKSAALKGMAQLAIRVVPFRGFAVWCCVVSGSLLTTYLRWRTDVLKFELLLQQQQQQQQSEHTDTSSSGGGVAFTQPSSSLDGVQRVIIADLALCCASTLVQLASHFAAQRCFNEMKWATCRRLACVDQTVLDKTPLASWINRVHDQHRLSSCLMREIPETIVSIARSVTLAHLIWRRGGTRGISLALGATVLTSLFQRLWALSEPTNQSSATFYREVEVAASAQKTNMEGIVVPSKFVGLSLFVTVLAINKGWITAEGDDAGATAGEHGEAAHCIPVGTAEGMAVAALTQVVICSGSSETWKRVHPYFRRGVAMVCVAIAQRDAHQCHFFLMSRVFTFSQLTSLGVIDQCGWKRSIKRRIDRIGVALVELLSGAWWFRSSDDSKLRGDDHFIVHTTSPFVRSTLNRYLDVEEKRILANDTSSRAVLSRYQLSSDSVTRLFRILGVEVLEGCRSFIAWDAKANATTSLGADTILYDMWKSARGASIEATHDAWLTLLVTLVTRLKVTVTFEGESVMFKFLPAVSLSVEDSASPSIPVEVIHSTMMFPEALGQLAGLLNFYGIDIPFVDTSAVGFLGYQSNSIIASGWLSTLLVRSWDVLGALPCTIQPEGETVGVDYSDAGTRASWAKRMRQFDNAIGGATMNSIAMENVTFVRESTLLDNRQGGCTSTLDSSTQHILSMLTGGEYVLQKFSCDGNKNERKSDEERQLSSTSMAGVMNLSFTATRGDVVALTGRSGAGKSTVFSLLKRLYTPSEGRITVNGRDITTLDVVALRRRIAYVPQNFQIFEGLTIEENILVGTGGLPTDAVKAAEVACCSDFIHRFTNGMQTVVGNRRDECSLSTGQSQRIAIARAIVQRLGQPPEILLLDEATSALDAATAHQVMANLVTLMKDNILLFTSHRRSLLSFATKKVSLTHNEQHNITDFGFESEKEQKQQQEDFVEYGDGTDEEGDNLGGDDLNVDVANGAEEHVNYEQLARQLMLADSNFADIRFCADNTDCDIEEEMGQENASGAIVADQNVDDHGRGARYDEAQVLLMESLTATMRDSSSSDADRKAARTQLIKILQVSVTALYSST